MVRVVIVDDSATVRAVLRRVLTASGAIEVVGEAGTAADGVAEAVARRPDVVVMDLGLPDRDGLDASAEINRRVGLPIVVVTSSASRAEIADAFRCTRHGVVGVFPKPEVPEGWSQLARDLVETIIQVGGRRESAAGQPAIRPPTSPRAGLRYLAVGASTGGPSAVCELLRALGPRFAVGIALVQHITPGFEAGLADWLSNELHIDVAPAVDGAELRPGTVRVAPPRSHLLVDTAGCQRLDAVTPARSGHRPAVDVLFESFVAHHPATVAAVLLSGMGMDGARGMLALKQAGVFTVAQSAESCAVFGMPKAALELGATDLALSPAEIGTTLTRAIGKVSPQ